MPHCSRKQVLAGSKRTSEIPGTNTDRQSNKWEVITPSGGTINSSDGFASVTFSVGTTSQDLYIAVAELDDASIPPANGGVELLGKIYVFSATNASGEPVTNFNGDVEITLQYDLNQLGGIDEQDLKINYYDEALGQWVELPSTVDTTNHTVTAITDHFTKFAILGPISSNGGSFVREDYRDADKSLINPDDDWMCWVAAAANILDWTGWSTPFFDSELDIFYTFQEYWTNAGGLMEYAWHWWFDGTEPEILPDWAQVEVPDGGNYWSDYNFFDYFYEDWVMWDDSSGLWIGGSHLMAAIDEYLHSDYGVSLTVYSESGGHTLTTWGYEYDKWGNYTGIYVTDSDDYMTDLKLLSVSLVDDLWYLDPGNDYGYSGWFIAGVQALDINPVVPNSAVPEPGTLILLGVGLISGLMLVRRKLLQKK